MAQLLLLVTLFATPAPLAPGDGPQALQDTRRYTDRVAEPARESACREVARVLCDRGGSLVCDFIQKELRKRRFSEKDQSECQKLLDDRSKLDEIVRQLRKFAGRRP